MSGFASPFLVPLGKAIPNPLTHLIAEYNIPDLQCIVILNCRFGGVWITWKETIRLKNNFRNGTEQFGISWAKDNLTSALYLCHTIVLKWGMKQPPIQGNFSSMHNIEKTELLKWVWLANLVDI
jgi:hypothetical protein